MITLPHISPKEFFELVEYTKIKNICVRYGCTTCGNQEYIRLITKTIGLQTIYKIIEAVTPEEIAKHDVDEWLWVLGFILMMYGNDVPQSNPLVRYYHDYNRKTSQYSDRVYTVTNQQETDFDKDLRRKRKEKKKRYFESLGTLRSNRQEIISEFEKCSLQEKLNIIANDFDRLPLYYPIDITTISQEFLNNLPINNLIALQKRFLNLNKKEWRYFLEKLNLAVTNKNSI